MKSAQQLGIILLVAGGLAACSGSGSTPAIDAARAVDSGHAIDGPVLAGIDASTTVPDARPQPDAVAQPDASTAACGTCPSDTHCGSANGIAVCRENGTGIPRFSHVFVIVMENLSYKTLMGNASITPYIAGLSTDNAYSSNYHGVLHPSLPNYLAMTSGQSIDIGCDCQPTGDTCNQFTCSTFTGSCGCPQTVDNIADQLEAASKTWKNYAEDMGTPCNVTAAGKYAPKHVPFLYYSNLQSDSARCNAHVVDYSTFATDILAHAVPQFTFITPNQDDDGHDPISGGDTNAMNADMWLQTNVPLITALDAYKNGGVLFIVWDEDDYSGLINKDDPVPMFVLSPYAKKGYGSTTRYDHYNFLATVEDGLGLTRLGNAAGADALSDFFAEH